MLLLAAAAIAMSPPAVNRQPVAATAQARAIVRVVSAVRVSFQQTTSADAPRLRQTMIRMPGAQLQPARLIEFE